MKAFVFAISLFLFHASCNAETITERMRNAQQGDPIAQTEVGLMYAHGSSVKRSDGEAVKWFSLAANQGYAKGEMCLGMMYAEGRGVQRDANAAHKWFLASAEQGLAMAQADVGQDYLEGWGTKKDIVKAYMWLRLAAGQDASKVTADLEALEKSMTPDQISEAKHRITEWTPLLPSRPQQSGQ